MYNKVTLLGRIGHEPEVRTTPSGASVCNFRMATNEVYKDRKGERVERTDWHSVVVWGKSAETMAKFVVKGQLLLIEGRLQNREWTDKQGQHRLTTEIRADRVRFVGGKPQGASKPTQDETPVEERAEAEVESGPF